MKTIRSGYVAVFVNIALMTNGKNENLYARKHHEQQLTTLVTSISRWFKKVGRWVP